MSRNSSDKITFQITVSRMVPSSLLLKDIRVTIGIGDISKTTCSGKLPQDDLTVTWNHPFLFTASHSTAVKIAVWTLPKKLTPEWDRQPLGNQMVTDVATLLKSGKGWKCKVPGLHGISASLYIICKVSDVLIVSNGHDCLSALEKYNQKLYEFTQQFKNIPAVSTLIELDQAALDLCPKDHPKHTIILGTLAVAFHRYYQWEGNISNLNRAIEIGQKKLDLCPPGHSEHTKALGGLALSLWQYYLTQKNQADLDKIIEMQERRLGLCPSGHNDHGLALSSLGGSLLERYYVQRDMADLNKAIEMCQKWVDICPPSHPWYSKANGNLATSLEDRYRRQENLADLNKAIELQEKSLGLCPPGHPHHTVALYRLACSLGLYYKATKTHSVLIRVVKLLKEAWASSPAQHYCFAQIIKLLATTVLDNSLDSQSSLTADESFPGTEDAFEIYRSLKTHGPAISINLWEASQSWVKNAEKHNHPSALEAYQTSLNTLDHLTSMQSTLNIRHETMQKKVTDLANNAFSCALRPRYGDLPTAVELLEQGRGILWNQLARFDISLTVLETQSQRGHELCHKLKQLSADLRRHVGGNDSEGKDPYWRVQEEWQSVVDQIRRLDGWSRFLLPPQFQHLQKAAEGGPVIIVNASKYTCDALIVLSALPPVWIPLDQCSLDQITEICKQLSKLIQDPYAYRQNRESWVKRMLRDLWEIVVEPIVNVLRDDIKLPLGSRIWWCPTAKLTSLPLHAAGPYKKDKKNLMDLYVSSYTPSLSALIRARERASVQKKVLAASGSANVISFAAVGQAQPNPAQKLSPLPEVENEIRRIRDRTNMPDDVKFEIVTGEAATIDGAIKAFHDHRWIHLACHGAQDPEKPFDSWFAMRDGPLTLMRIIQERYMHSEFAFLSACHTAVGDASTPDEVLHLAAGMQFAGFNGVIGTLWRVEDEITQEVVTRFYEEMFAQPVTDVEHVAEALNVATVELTEVPLESRIVFVHVGL